MSRRDAFAIATVAATSLSAPAIPWKGPVADPVLTALPRLEAAKARSDEAMSAYLAADDACGSPYVEVTIPSGRRIRVKDRNVLIETLNRSPSKFRERLARLRNGLLDDEDMAAIDEIFSAHYQRLGYTADQFDREHAEVLAKFDNATAAHENRVRLYCLHEKEEASKAADNDLWSVRAEFFELEPSTKVGAAAFLIHAANWLSEGYEAEYILPALVAAAKFLDPHSTQSMGWALEDLLVRLTAVNDDVVQAEEA